MKLFFAAASPFARKVTVSAAELGVALERVPAAPHPINRDSSVVAQNPLGKVPTAVADDGTVLYDSRVICEYVDALGGGRLFPAPGPARAGAGSPRGHRPHPHGVRTGLARLPLRRPGLGDPPAGAGGVVRTLRAAAIDGGIKAGGVNLPPRVGGGFGAL